MNKVIVIQGPTASGKTDLAIKIAESLNTEIISADSRQFYKELTIGTAKPTEEELSRVNHHFIDCFSIKEEISSANFAKQAMPVLMELLDQNGFAVLVGGSGMYVDALIDGLDEVPVNQTIRSELTDLHNKFGLEPLRNELAALDPEYFLKVDQNNPMRVIRALEAIRESGQKMSELLKNKQAEKNYQVIRLSIDWPRDILYARINKRVDDMISNGLIREVSTLIEFRDLNALNTVGYKEFFDYFEGKYNLEKAIDLIKQHTRNYAKRQLTWLRRYNDLNYLDPVSQKSVLEQAMEIIE